MSTGSLAGSLAGRCVSEALQTYILQSYNCVTLFWCPSVRPSVRPSVCPSVRLSPFHRYTYSGGSIFFPNARPLLWSNASLPSSISININNPDIYTILLFIYRTFSWRRHKKGPSERFIFFFWQMTTVMVIYVDEGTYIVLYYLLLIFIVNDDREKNCDIYILKFVTFSSQNGWDLPLLSDLFDFNWTSGAWFESSRLMKI